MPKLHNPKARKEHICGKCGRAIEPGEKYFWWANRVGFGRISSVKKVRCEQHKPKWWETSGNPRLKEVEAQKESLHEQVEEIEDQESASALLNEIQAWAEEQEAQYSEKADNIEEGFGHPTQQSEDAQELAEQWDEYRMQIEETEAEIGDEPGILDEPESPEEDDYEYESEYEEALSIYEELEEEYEANQDEWEEWRNAARQIIEELIGEMPE